jgi:hypothetical protein
VAGAGAEFAAAKSKTARRFVTLGPRRGCPAVRGGQRGGGRPPGGSQGAASATATEGAGPGEAYKRERVLFIGTQFSILYTSMSSTEVGHAREDTRQSVCCELQ